MTRPPKPYSSQGVGRGPGRGELRLLEQAPDAEVAAWTGRSANGVKVKRNKLGIPTADDRRRLNGRKQQGE